MGIIVPILREQEDEKILDFQNIFIEERPEVVHQKLEDLNHFYKVAKIKFFAEKAFRNKLVRKIFSAMNITSNNFWPEKVSVIQILDETENYLVLKVSDVEYWRLKKINFGIHHLLFEENYRLRIAKETIEEIILYRKDL